MATHDENYNSYNYFNTFLLLFYFSIIIFKLNKTSNDSLSKIQF